MRKLQDLSCLNPGNVNLRIINRIIFCYIEHVNIKLIVSINIQNADPERVNFLILVFVSDVKVFAFPDCLSYEYRYLIISHFIRVLFGYYITIYC